MRLWLTKDKEGLCLWRTRPILGGDGVWWEEDEDFDEREGSRVPAWSVEQSGGRRAL